LSDPITSYRKQVLKTYRREFAIHTQVATSLEAALLLQRVHPTPVHLAVDMLALQSMKSHATVSILAQHGLMEDTATIARRLLELSIQVVYIGAESVEEERLRRAGCYLAFMWRQLPPRIKHRLPPHVRRQWTSLGRSYGRFVPRKAKKWGPDFRTMFKQAGSEDLYLKDYSILSAIAHGTADSQVFQFASPAIRVHSHEFAPILLVYSSRYYLVVAEQWNRLFHLLNDATFDELTRRVTDWRLP
jgi:hypothetical protein